jgi:hypothetical protein
MAITYAASYIDRVASEGDLISIMIYHHTVSKLLGPEPKPEEFDVLAFMDRVAELTRQQGYGNGTALFTAFTQAMEALETLEVATAAPMGAEVDPQLIFLTDGEAGDPESFHAARRAAELLTPANFKALLVRGASWGFQRFRDNLHVPSWNALCSAVPPDLPWNLMRLLFPSRPADTFLPLLSPSSSTPQRKNDKIKIKISSSILTRIHTSGKATAATAWQTWLWPEVKKDPGAPTCAYWMDSPTRRCPFPPWWLLSHALAPRPPPVPRWPLPTSAA